MTKPKHRLAKSRHPGKLQCKSTPHRLSVAQLQRRGFYGQLGGIGVAAAAIAVPIMFGGAALVAGVPLDLSSPPSPSMGQRPIGPSWLPGSGVGLHLSIGNPLFRANVLDGSVASSPEVLHTASSFTVPSSTTPMGLWVGGRWISSDPAVRPSEPCPSPVLDPVGWRAWWAKYYPGIAPPTPPVTAAPPVTVPVSAPVAVPPTTQPVVTSPEPLPGSPPAVETPPSVEAPAPVAEPVTQPVTVDVPVVDLPPVTVPVGDIPVDPPPIDLPPITVPDPVAPVVDDTVAAAASDLPVAPELAAAVQPQSNSAMTGGAGDPVPPAAAPAISAPTTQLNDARKSPAAIVHSTSGNGPGSRLGGDFMGRRGSDYVGRHRVDGPRQDSMPGPSVHDSHRPSGGGHVSGDGHRAERSSDHGGHHAGNEHHDSGGGRHRAVDHGGHGGGGSHDHGGSHGGSHGNSGGGHRGH